MTPSTGTLSRPQAAAYIGISVRSLDELSKLGLVRPVRIKRRVLFLEEELVRFMRSSMINQKLSSGDQQ